MITRIVLVRMVGAVGCAALASIAVPDVATAAATGGGASMIFMQNGAVTDQVCANQPVYVRAAGFAPNRRVIELKIVLAGPGDLGGVTAGVVKLDHGAATGYVGEFPGGVFVGSSLELTFQTGRSGRSADRGSATATLVDC